MDEATRWWILGISAVSNFLGSASIATVFTGPTAVAHDPLVEFGYNASHALLALAIVCLVAITILSVDPRYQSGYLGALPPTERRVSPIEQSIRSRLQQMRHRS